MAKRKTNKAQLIKDALDANPDATPAEIAKSLKRHGVTANYVSNIKYSSQRKSKRSTQGKKRRAKKSKPVANDVVSLTELIKARKFADELGGVDNARHLLDAVAKLQSN